MYLRRGLPATLALALVAGALGILVTANPAHGQAGVDQYIPSPKPGDSGASATDPSGALGDPQLGDSSPAASKKGKKDESGQVATGSAGSDDDTNLPGTSYPVTGFVLIVLAIAVLALLARLGLPAFQRWRQGAAGG